MKEHSTGNRKVLGSIPSGVEAFFFHRKNYSNIYWKFHLVLNNVNSKLPVDRVDMVEFGYHGEWYTLLIIDIIHWNDLEKFVIRIHITLSESIFEKRLRNPRVLKHEDFSYWYENKSKKGKKYYVWFANLVNCKRVEIGLSLN